MAVRLAAIQASVATTWSYTQSPQMSPQVATGIGTAALHSLYALLQADDEQTQAWRRAALLLTDLGHALLLDTLGTSQLDQCQLRFSALRDLPDIDTINSLGDIQALIGGAISIGAPRYNSGDIVGCCTIYWATMMALVSAPVLRGYPGHARAIAPLREIVEKSHRRSPSSARASTSLPGSCAMRWMPSWRCKGSGDGRRLSMQEHWPQAIQA